MRERLRIIWGSEPNYRKECRAQRVQADTHLRTLRSRRDIPDDQPYSDSFAILFGHTQADVRIESANVDSTTVIITPQSAPSEIRSYALNVPSDELSVKVGESGLWERVADNLEGYEEASQLATALFDCNDVAMMRPPTPPSY